MKGVKMEILKAIENNIKNIISNEKTKSFEKGKKEAYHDVCMRCCDFLEKEKNNNPLKQILCLCVKNGGHIPIPKEKEQEKDNKVLCFSCIYFAYYETGYSELTITSEWCKCLKNKFDIKRDEHGYPNGIDEISHNCEFFKAGSPTALGYNEKN
jgi:hypothetical protein